MNKGELVDAIAAHCQDQDQFVTKKTIDQVVSSFTSVVIAAVAKGDKVSLVGFGSFEPRDRKGREGRNPKTGEKMDIPPTTVPCFSPGKGFKEKVAS